MTVHFDEYSETGQIQSKYRSPSGSSTLMKMAAKFGICHFVNTMGSSTTVHFDNFFEIAIIFIEMNCNEPDIFFSKITSDLTIGWRFL